MQIAKIGSLSVKGDRAVLALRRKLFAIAETVGIDDVRCIRLASAASDHAKALAKTGTIDVDVAIDGSGPNRSSA